MTRWRVFLVSIGVCLFIGVPAGMVAFGVLTGDPFLVFERDIAGVPLLVYGVISGGPLAVLAGVMGGVILLGLLRADRWNPRWPGWVLACAGCGLVAGLVVTTTIALLSVADGSGAPPLRMFVSLGVTGALCGALLGLYGWNLKRHGLAEQW